MIYVSSSCVRHSLIRDSVRELADAGFTAIELSGGTHAYDELEHDLLALKEEYKLQYICHNYFPPPEKDFVLNIASLDDEVSEMSTLHVLRALELSKALGGDKYAFHAGFLINIGLDEIGKSIARKELFDREQAKARFIENYDRIMNEAEGIKLYLENNVISQTNFSNYKGLNPFFITDSTGVKEFGSLGFHLLLDVAHLKVSCTTLGLNFMDELTTLANATDYIHISDNDGFHDNNESLSSNSELYSALSALDFSGKTITLEVYSGLKKLRESFDNIEQLIVS